MVFTFCQTGSEWLVRFFLVRKCFGSFFLVRNCFGSEKTVHFFGSEMRTSLVQKSCSFREAPCTLGSDFSILRAHPSFISGRLQEASEAARGLGGRKRPRRPQEASEAARGLGGCKRPRICNFAPFTKNGTTPSPPLSEASLSLLTCTTLVVLIHNSTQIRDGDCNGDCSRNKTNFYSANPKSKTRSKIIDHYY